MSFHAFHLNLHAIRFQRKCCPILRNMPQHAEDISAKGVIFLHRQRNPKCLSHIIQRSTAFHSICVYSKLFNFLFIRINIPYQQLQQIMQGNHAAHPAIFIQYHSKQLFLLLHIPKQNIRFHNLRYKIRLLYRLRHHSFSILLHQAKIYLCIQHTNNIICILFVNGIICIAASQNCFLPFRIRFLQAQHSHIYTMCADLLYRNIIKGKYIPNPPCFLRINRPFFLSCLQHHIDFLFGNLLLLICRVNSKELQHTVGRNRKKGH